MRGGKTGAVILPGDAEASLLLQRIKGLGDDDRMPLERDPLPDEQVRILERWIAQGAEWPDSHAGEGAGGHWAYTAPTLPALRAVKDEAWCRNPIDRFVLSKLEASGLHGAPEADRARLLRRVSLDLIGLPPTVAEVDEFVSDVRPDAYERVVERLLASPRYGERWARPWLDLARYADTNGYEKDLARSLWPWRDWVINALNADMPFDRFTVEQIAGDLLPNADRSQQIATGFHRNTMLNDEGGIDPEEFRVAAVVDRTNTTATIWLGTTMGCCQCHDHKYDPFTQREYYSLLAFFNQTEDVGVGNGPEIQVPTPEQESRIAGMRARIAELESVTGPGARDAAQEAWESSAGLELSHAGIDAGLRHQYTFDGPPAMGSAGAGEGGDAVVDRGADPHHGRIVGGADTRRVPGIGGNGIHLDGGAFVDCGAAGGFDRTDAFSYGAWVKLEGSGAILGKIDDTHAYRGFDLFNNNGKLEAHFVHEWPADGLKVETGGAVDLARWRHVLVTYDGTGTPGGVKIYVDGEPQETRTANDTLKSSIRNDVPLKIGSRHASGMVSGTIDDVRIYDRVLSAAEIRVLMRAPLASILAAAPDKRDESQRRAVRDAYIRETPALLAKTAEIAELQKNIAAMPIATTMVLKELAQRRPDYIMLRGDFRNHGEAVTPDVPGTLHPFPEGQPRNRLGLARWLVSPENPLVARVTVNRAWEAFFGDGLVLTSEDFGSQGDPPTNPELLDWLAGQFVERGWSFKALHRLIVTSATYRQSARVDEALLERDPYNRLYGRGPRIRFDAELVRDNALAIAGLLSDKLGGPSVMPPQPAGIWVDSFANFDTPNEKWIDAVGADRYRRGIYTYWRRSASYPSGLTFDAARRDVCVVKRSRTNTPLQALTTLNDPVYIEAALGLARRMMRESPGPDPAARAAYGFRICLARAPSEGEVSDLAALQARCLEKFRGDPGAAGRLTHRGELDVAGLDGAELAAWTVVANVLLNLDETINRS